MSSTPLQQAELTPLEKVEFLYTQLLDWYGDADKKELRAAAKLLLVALDKFATFGGSQWSELVTDYMTILQKDPERFQRILDSNRGELKSQPSETRH